MSETESGTGSAGADSNFVTLRPGRTAGRYCTVSVLGQGGSGITYRAMDSELGREVAIKKYLPAALAVRHDGATVVPRSKSATEDFAWGRDRFIAEGRTLAGGWFVLGLPRIVPHSSAPSSSAQAAVATAPESLAQDPAQELLEQARREQKAALEEADEAAARLRVEEADRKGAEAVEAALGLTQSDRQRIQVALPAPDRMAAISLAGCRVDRLDMIRGRDPRAPRPPTKQR